MSFTAIEGECTHVWHQLGALSNRFWQEVDGRSTASPNPRQVVIATGPIQARGLCCGLPEITETLSKLGTKRKPGISQQKLNPFLGLELSGNSLEWYNQGEKCSPILESNYFKTSPCLLGYLLKCRELIHQKSATTKRQNCLNCFVLNNTCG